MSLPDGWEVTLENVELTHCHACGASGVSIWRMGPLMEEIEAAQARGEGSQLRRLTLRQNAQGEWAAA